MIEALTTLPQKKEGEKVADRMNNNAFATLLPKHKGRQVIKKYKMNIKETLKANNITQEEFASYLGMTREGFNMNLNKGKQKKSMEDSLKLFLAEKRGFTFDLKEDKINLTIKL